MAGKPAVFLDRDGVLIADNGPLTNVSDIDVCVGAVAGLRAFENEGYKLIVISNQAVVARGLLSETETEWLHGRVERALAESGAPRFAGFYYCPHHPSATVPEYRVNCMCRKPRPGLLLRAAHEHDIDLARSIMIGDRVTDICAGRAVGCRTILIQSGQHTAPLIETVDPIDDEICPDLHASSLFDAALWINGRKRYAA